MRCSRSMPARCPMPPRYFNKRSELWFSTVMRAQAGGIAFCALGSDGVSRSNLDVQSVARLRLQVMAPKWRMGPKGQRVVEKKEETKKRLRHSPDDMDTLWPTSSSAGKRPTRCRSMTTARWGRRAMTPGTIAGRSRPQGGRGSGNRRDNSGAEIEPATSWIWATRATVGLPRIPDSQRNRLRRTRPAIATPSLSLQMAHIEQTDAPNATATKIDGTYSTTDDQVICNRPKSHKGSVIRSSRSAL